jgi:hypothetical protein
MDDNERAVVGQERQAHRDLVTYSRDRATHLMDLAAAHPELFLFVAIDGMDSKETQVPWLRSDAAFSKDLDNTGRQAIGDTVGGHACPWPWF